MKRVMRIGLTLTLAALWVTAAGAAEWETDFAKASAAAKQADKYMLLDFSGSDWCGWCIKLDKEVFSKPEFKAYAEKNLVCVLVDFPRRKTQSAELKKQNESLSRKYGIEGFPTIVLLAPDGALAGQTGYQPGGAGKYVEHLKSLIADYEKAHPRKAPTAAEAEPKPAAAPAK